MKTCIIFFLTVALSASFGSGQRADKEVDSFYFGTLPKPTRELTEMISALPKLTLSEDQRLKKNSLPDSLDNSQLDYFRPVFNQSGGSCSQAAGIGYNFTYEINSVRGTSAADSSNQFPTHHTYNFLNGGDGNNGSWYFDGWNIAEANGIPDLKLYGGLYPDSLEYRHQLWTDGYEKYASGMNNRVKEQFVIPVGTPEGLLTLKQYMNDYCDGSPSGGIVNFSAGVSVDWQIGRLDDGTPHAGEYAISKWNTDPNPNHSMTFAGYNDSIRWDYNNDGRYSNYDSNGDLLPMTEWEVGALLMVNSAGTDWPNWDEGGKAWVMYRTLAKDITDGGIWRNETHTIRVRDSFEPLLKMKAVVSHQNRSKVKIYAGVSADTSATEPEHTLSFPIFLYQGGDYGMRADNDTLEFGLDITPLLSYTESGIAAKYFLCLDENDPMGSDSGTVSFMSVTNSDSIEFASPFSNIAVSNDSSTYISVTVPSDFDPPVIATSSLPAAVKNDYYEQQLSASSGTPPYTWTINIDYEEISNTGNYPVLADSLLTVTNNDDGYGVIDLDFSFPFYGRLYDTLTVSTDGSILFEEGFKSIRDESSVISNRTISPYAADLMAYPEYGDGIFFYKDTNFAEIRWITSKYDQPGIDLDFAVKLYPDGKIEFFYGQDMTSGLTWASGISNGEVNSALISSLSNTYDPSADQTSFITYDYPYGMKISSGGLFYGTPDLQPDTWQIDFNVTDDKNISSSKTVSFTLVSDISSPQNVNIEISGTSAFLSWDPVDNASVYDIYRSEKPYSGFVKISSSENTEFEDTDISTSSKYFYYITGKNYK